MISRYGSHLRAELLSYLLLLYALCSSSSGTATNPDRQLSSRFITIRLVASRYCYLRLTRLQSIGDPNAKKYIQVTVNYASATESSVHIKPFDQLIEATCRVGILTRAMNKVIRVKRDQVRSRPCVSPIEPLTYAEWSSTAASLQARFPWICRRFSCQVFPLGDRCRRKTSAALGQREKGC